MKPARTAADIAALAQLACLLEVSAPKPGNVSPGRHFADLRYEDFLTSAIAIGQPFARAGEQPLGETVRQAVDATACWTRTNTNLGMVLLLAPLAKAAASGGKESPGGPDQPPPRLRRSAGASAKAEGPPLRNALRSVLEQTTVDDARQVYAAIRRAAPGGLGNAPSQDVAADPDVTLLEAMRLAADRDSVASEYATNFEVTFERGAPALERARRDGLPWGDAIVETFLQLLAQMRDTHIVRRTGVEAADRVSRLARGVLDAGGVRSPEGRQSIEAMDGAIRDSRNSHNPGTTADLTAASIFVTLIEEAGSR